MLVGCLHCRLLIVINFRVTFVTFGVASIDAQREAAVALIDDPNWRPAVVLLDLQLACHVLSLPRPCNIFLPY